MQNCIFLLKTLISDIFRDACLISNLADRVYKISICPKFSSPQMFLYFGVNLKDLSPCYAFYHCYYRCRTFARNRLNQKMNIVSFLYLQTNILQGLINLFVEDNSTIFCRTNKMIQQYTNIM